MRCSQQGLLDAGSGRARRVLWCINRWVKAELDLGHLHMAFVVETGRTRYHPRRLRGARSHNRAAFDDDSCREPRVVSVRDEGKASVDGCVSIGAPRSPGSLNKRESALPSVGALAEIKEHYE